MTTETAEPVAEIAAEPDHVFFFADRAGGHAVPVDPATDRGHILAASCRCRPTLEVLTFEDLRNIPTPGQPLTQGIRREVFVHHLVAGE